MLCIWFYILKTVLPMDLVAFYPVPKELNWLALPFSLSILATLAISAGLFLVRRRWPGLLAAWLSYLVILAPNSGLIRISEQLVADRYSYMAMLGSVMLTAAGLCRLWRMSRGHPDAMGGMAICLGALVALTAMTRNQCRTWLNSETLWAHAMAHGADSEELVHYNLGVALRRKRSYQAAEAEFIEALRLNPGLARAHFGLGHLLALMGKPEAAKAEFIDALRLNPDYADAHTNLGTILSGEKRYAEAEAHFKEAIRLNPRLVIAHFNLGLIREARGEARGSSGSLRRGHQPRTGLRQSTPQPGWRALPPRKLPGSQGRVRRGHTARSRPRGIVHSHRDAHGRLSRSEVPRWHEGGRIRDPRLRVDQMEEPGHP